MSVDPTGQEVDNAIARVQGFPIAAIMGAGLGLLVTQKFQGAAAGFAAGWLIGRHLQQQDLGSAIQADFAAHAT